MNRLNSYITIQKQSMRGWIDSFLAHREVEPEEEAYSLDNLIRMIKDDYSEAQAVLRYLCYFDHSIDEKTMNVISSDLCRHMNMCREEAIRRYI